MFSLVLILHVFVCLLIIFFVLMQSGRGAELGAAFGGVGQAQSTRSEMSGIGKATTVVAVLFMLTSLVLAYLSSEKARESVVRDIKAVPVVPGVEEPVLPATEIQIPADGVVVPPNEEEVPSKDLEQTAAPALAPSTEPTQEVDNLQNAAPNESAPAQKTELYFQFPFNFVELGLLKRSKLEQLTSQTVPLPQPLVLQKRLLQKLDLVRLWPPEKTHHEV